MCENGKALLHMAFSMPSADALSKGTFEATHDCGQKRKIPLAH